MCVNKISPKMRSLVSVGSALVLGLFVFVGSASASAADVSRNDLGAVFTVETTDGTKTVHQLLQDYEAQKRRIASFESVLGEQPDLVPLSLEMALAIMDQAFRTPVSAIPKGSRFYNAILSARGVIELLETADNLEPGSTYGAITVEINGQTKEVKGHCCKTSGGLGSTTYDCPKQKHAQCALENNECTGGSTACATGDSILLVDEVSGGL